jgi:NADH dehydrogenase [ubiquinone] 1 alpha subcomplex assembly factor 7
MSPQSGTQPEPSSTQASAQSSLCLCLAPSPTPTSTLLGSSSLRFQKLPIGSRIEVSATAFKIARQVGELLAGGDQGSDSSGGAALIVDYGGEKAFGNSFRVKPLYLFLILLY